MNQTSKKRLLQLFSKLYPHPRSELVFNDDYQLVLAVILSAQATDKKVNEITPKLFQAFPGFRALSKAKLPQVENIVRPINYYKTKAKNLVELAKVVMSGYGGRLPSTYQELTALPGIGNKTANVVLAETGFPAFPVDTHVFRVARRLGLSEAKIPRKTEEDMKLAFNKRHWRNLHHYLILHGRRICRARNPLCPECGIAELCPSRHVFHPELKKRG